MSIKQVWGYDKEELAEMLAIAQCEIDALKAGKAMTPTDAHAALRNLVERLDFIHADPAYKSVWTINQVHTGPYQGPTYTKELEAARAALTAAAEVEPEYRVCKQCNCMVIKPLVYPPDPECVEAIDASSPPPFDAAAEVGECTWKPDDEETWHTSCGHAFIFNDGTPRENDVKFCCYCGHPCIEG